jgi:SAM-dependent methyltransferase
MAVPLAYFLDPSARYIGFDIHAPSIEWCKEKISARWRNFRFDLFNLENAQYNPKSNENAASFSFPYEDEQFTLITLCSVFTHMPRKEVANYLRNCARVLKRGGRVFCTAYLMTPEAERAMAAHQNAVKFDHVVEDNRIQDLEHPAMAVAQTEALFRRDVEAAGLVFDQLAVGWWSGLRTKNTKQDIIILSKP